MHNANQFCRRTRREFLWQTGGGFGAVALSSLLGQDDFFRTTATAADAAAAPHGKSHFVNPMAPKPPMIPAKAKSVIFIFCYGGPSHVDTFDYKPKLYPLDGKTIPIKTFGRGGKRNEGRVVGPKWEFKQYGQCGKYVSDLFPHLAQHVDKLAFIHSMYAESPIHGSAMLMMNSGRILSGNPSLGSWLTYGLGSENENLPGYVVMLDKTGGPISGPKNWSSGYMPAAFQGTVVRADGTAIHDLDLPPGMTRTAQRRMLDRLREKNQEHLARHADNTELAARIASYELAARMQLSVPEITDLGTEPAHILKMYGADDTQNADKAAFARNCILARRLIERGVRFVQLFNGAYASGGKLNWDGHSDLKAQYDVHAGILDQPAAALIRDLKQRGLLQDTLVVWCTEFGRMPFFQKGAKGRDHNPDGFTCWLTGAGVKPGVSHGECDELGQKAVKDVHPLYHFNATILHLLGLDHERLSFEHNGIQRRLTNVEGRVIPEILA